MEGTCSSVVGSARHTRRCCIVSSSLHAFMPGFHALEVLGCIWIVPWVKSRKEVDVGAECVLLVSCRFLGESSHHRMEILPGCAAQLGSTEKWREALRQPPLLITILLEGNCKVFNAHLTVSLPSLGITTAPFSRSSWIVTPGALFVG